jgi:hypothetical protein
MQLRAATEPVLPSGDAPWLQYLSGVMREGEKAEVQTVRHGLFSCAKIGAVSSPLEERNSVIAPPPAYLDLGSHDIETQITWRVCG